ncbi:cholesterol 7-desaturase nvd [Ixodes scapularis]
MKPYNDLAEQVPEVVKLKKWEVHEVLGFVFVWHHAEGEEPSWRIEDIPQITKGDWKLFFRHEHRVSCHIHDLIENAFDTAHVKHLHKPNSLLSPTTFFRSGGDSLWARFTMNHWTVKNRIEAHRCVNEFDAQVSILGKRWPVLRTIAETQNIGPALILQHARSKFGIARVVIAILPEEPLQMRVIQRMHFEPDAWWFFRYFLSKAHISQRPSGAPTYAQAKAVVELGEEVFELSSFRGAELGVNIELWQHCTGRLTWRGLVGDRGDFGVGPEFLDVSYSGTFREMLCLRSKVRHEDHTTSILQLCYAPCDAYFSSEKRLDVAFQKDFPAGNCVGNDGHKNTRPWRQVHVVRDDSDGGWRRFGSLRR